MKKVLMIVLASVIITSLIATHAMPFLLGYMFENVIRVPYDYLTIQEAINAAAPGSTILVGNGTYPEHLVIDKALRLLGEDKTITILDGGGSDTIITVTADNVLIDGFTIRNSTRGIFLNHVSNCTISGNIVMLCEFYGIWLNNSGNNIISSNLITACGTGNGLYYGGGIELSYSFGNTIYGNILANNMLYGLELVYSNHNLLHNNTLMKTIRGWGIVLQVSSENTVHHNSFIDNYEQIYLYEAYNNVWDDGAEGNYWDTYAGLDDGSGGRVAGDGVGDTDLPHLGVDNYPLISPYDRISIVWETMVYPVTLLSNSTVSTFRFIQPDKKITFNVNGPIDTAGFCNITIPKNLLRDDPWTILLNDINITSQTIITENQTHTLIHFTYNHSTYNIQIIGTWVVPEFPSTIILTMLMLLTTTSIVVIKKFRKMGKQVVGE